ncbi:hypothetical protein NDU88_004483 [Pleurodeles waltl]|uniref:Uncharacterized protein n=1 Tax=Pleurodeles waltl TaxID=8319 RepID=A0AAV7UJC5_PLEWA|nr:hypothetical protein NDU88_004483 [Pleurodeles waltl]
MAALQAAPPWRILPAGGNPAGNRRTRLGDRGFTAAVGIHKEAPPACWRCFRGRRPWRSMTTRVRMTPLVTYKRKYCHPETSSLAQSKSPNYDMVPPTMVFRH